MPEFHQDDGGEVYGLDGFWYRRTPYGHALRVRRPGFWLALQVYGLETAMRKPGDRPLMGYRRGGWVGLGSYLGQTGELYFDSPLAPQDIRLIMAALGLKPAPTIEDTQDAKVPADTR